MSRPPTLPRTFPPCPACGSPAAVPIAYGYPSAETWKAEQRGEVVLGGCLVGPESPAYECRDCHIPLPWPPRDQTPRFAALTASEPCCSSTSVLSEVDD